MATLRGLLALSQASTNEHAGEFQQAVLVRNSKGMGKGATLFGLMAKLENEVADSIEYNWFEREPTRLDFFLNDSTTDSMAGTGAATGVTFDTGTTSGSPDTTVTRLLLLGSILKNETTGEFFRVTAVNSSGASVDLERDFANGTGVGTAATQRASNSVAGHKFTLITSGKDEGADPAEALYEDPTTLTNYIQTYNESVALANSFKGTVLRTDLDGPLKERRIQALERIANRIELSYFFGVKTYKTGTNGRIYYTGGIQNAIDTTSGLSANVLAGTGTAGSETVTLAALQEWLQAFMLNGSDMKVMFCGPKAYSALSNYANNASGGFRIMNTETVFGMNITEILTPFGSVGLTMHPLFKNATAYNSWMVGVDLGLIKQKVFEPLFLEDNIQNNGSDSYKEQYRAKLGLKLQFPGAFGYASKITGITAS